MVLTGQKIHKERLETGECSEGLPGSTKSVGCVLYFDRFSTSDRLRINSEKRQESFAGSRHEYSRWQDRLGRPWWFLDNGSERGVCARETDGVPQTEKS
jgi:hypothetical protein